MSNFNSKSDLSQSNILRDCQCTAKSCGESGGGEAGGAIFKLVGSHCSEIQLTMYDESIHCSMP